MLGQRELFLNLIHLDLKNHGHRVFLTVDDTLLERAVHLAPGHGGGIDAGGFPGLDMDGVFHGANLQALGVLRRLDHLPGVGQVAEPVFPESQTLHLHLVQIGEQRLSDGTVQDLIHVDVIPEEEGNIQYLNRWGETA